MSSNKSEMVDQLIMRGQLDADVLRQRAQDTNCNALVNVSY